MTTPISFVRALLLVGGLTACGSGGLEPSNDSTQDGSTQGSTFACGALQCDTKTEYCYETFICVAQLGTDLAGANPQVSCRPIPTQCEGKSEKSACKCTVESLGGTDSASNPFASGNGIDIDTTGAADGCTIAQNCV